MKEDAQVVGEEMEVGGETEGGMKVANDVTEKEGAEEAEEEEVGVRIVEEEKVAKDILVNMSMEVAQRILSKRKSSPLSLLSEKLVRKSRCIALTKPTAVATIILSSLIWLCTQLRRRTPSSVCAARVSAAASPCCTHRPGDQGPPAQHQGLMVRPGGQPCATPCRLTETTVQQVLPIPEPRLPAPAPQLVF